MERPDLKAPKGDDVAQLVKPLPNSIRLCVQFLAPQMNNAKQPNKS